MGEYKNASFLGSLYYPDILLKSEGKIYRPINEPVQSLKSVAIQPEWEIENQESTNHKSGRYFFFVYNTENYYHFLYDTLPYLINYNKSTPAFGEFPKLLMNYPNESRKEHYQFVLELLEIWGLKNKIEIIQPNTTYESVIVSDSLTFTESGKPDSIIFKMYDNLAFLAGYSDTPKKIYVSRRSHIHGDMSNMGTNYTSRRKMENEDELVEFLETQGFVEVFPELMSTKEKIQMFRGATHVVGAIGGGMCNVLFSLPSTKVTTIVSPGFLDVNERFHHCLKRTRLHYFFDTQHTETTEFKTNMRVQCGDIIGEITSMNGDRLNIKYSDRKIAGWSSDVKYLCTTVRAKDCVKLDNGLNSPWKINLEEFKNDSLCYL